MTVNNPHAVARLARGMLARVTYDVPATITAPLPAFDIGDPDKGLSPQREAQFRHSANVRNGVVPPYPSPNCTAALPSATPYGWSRSMQEGHSYEAEQMADHPGADDYAAGFNLKYGDGYV